MATWHHCIFISDGSRPPTRHDQNHLPKMNVKIKVEEWLRRIALSFCILCLGYNNVKANSRCSKANPSNINTNIRINGSTGAIYSPDYSPRSLYPSNTTCYWTINGPLGYVIRLTFTLFELEPASSNKNCANADFVRVYDGSSSSNSVLGLYCGRLGRFSVTSTGRFMLVEFRSNFNVEGKGFIADYEVVKPGGQEPPQGKEAPIALIIAGATVSLIVVIAIIFIAAGGKDSLRLRKRARRRQTNDLSLESRVSMNSAQAPLPSIKSKPHSAKTRSETRSLKGNIHWSRPGSSCSVVPRNLSLPQLVVTNEEGKDTLIFPQRELRTRVLLHTSPFNKRRFNRVRRFSTDLLTLPSIRRNNQISPLAAHAQSYLVSTQSTLPSRTRSASFRRYSSGSIR